MREHLYPSRRGKGRAGGRQAFEAGTGGAVWARKDTLTNRGTPALEKPSRNIQRVYPPVEIGVKRSMLKE